MLKYKHLTNEELKQKIEQEQLKETTPNYTLADLLREKLNRLGYDVRDYKNKPSQLIKL